MRPWLTVQVLCCGEMLLRLCRVKVESPVGALGQDLFECLASGEPEDEGRLGGECAFEVGCGP
jgi:hypothetical protein